MRGGAGCGIIVKKRHPASNRVFISSNATKGGLTVEQVEDFADQQEAGGASKKRGKRPRDEQHHHHGIEAAPPPPAYDAAVSGGAAVPPPQPQHAAPPHAPAASRVKLIPEGPNGRLSRSQLVQLVRIKYQASSIVPRFYVCNRCGVKGEHWVQECPTARDADFDRTIVWGEPSKKMEQARAERKLREQEEGVEAEVERLLNSESGDGCVGITAAGALGMADGQTVEEDDDDGSSSSSSSSSDDNSSKGDDDDGTNDRAVPGGDDNNDDAMIEISARTAPLGFAEEEAPKGAADAPAVTVSPALASDGKKNVTFASEQQQQLDSANAPPRRRRAPRQRAHSPTLYERLTEQDRLVERGLLLQAIRFFCVNNYFLPASDETTS